MPKRNNVSTIETGALQGEGSYVVMRRLTVGEVRALTKQGRKLNEAGAEREDMAIEISSGLLASVVLKWNWVDDAGEPLAQPHKNEDIFDLLTDEEFAFLSEQVLGGKARKNSSGGSVTT